VLENFKVVCDVFFEEDQRDQQTRPIMICGPTGIGKSCFTDYFMERYFQNYPNSNREIRRFNCATIPENMVESTLFGHERGAFTGANRERDGIFDNSGRLIILEEIGELPKYIQAKLLILIEQQTFMRVGSNNPGDFNGQIIATTNKPQEDFRPDFYFRFFPFFVSAIHERRSDILYYFDHFDSEILKLLSNSDVTALLSYHWPGNVREIQLFCRLFRINAKQHTITYHSNDILPDSSPEEVAFSDLSKLFVIPEKYSKFKINKPEMFLNEIQQTNSDHKLDALIRKFETLTDNYFGFTGVDSPFKEELEYLQITKNRIFEQITNENNIIFNSVNNEDINKIIVAYSIFCILFFRDFRANHDLLDFNNFTIPEIKLDFKKLKTIFTNIDAKELSEISLEILSLFLEEKEFNYDRKQLPLNYTERKDTIKKIYEENKGNHFLAKLVGTPKTDHNKAEAEIDIKTLKEKDILKSYYGTLFHATGGVNKAVAKFSGMSPGSTSQKIAKYKIKEKGSPYMLKAYKSNKR
jgi:hypothetical protein